MLSVSDFVGVETALDPRPVGEEKVAFRSNRAGVPQVFVVSGGGGDPEQVTDTEGVVYAIDPRPGHDQLLFVTDVGGDEQYGLHLLDLDSGDVQSLMSEPDVIFNHGAWSPDGRLLSYTSNRRTREHFDIYVLNVELGVEHCVWSIDAMPRAGCFNSDSSVLLAEVPNLEVGGDNDLFALQLNEDGSPSGPAALLLTAHEADPTSPAQWTSAVVHGSGCVIALCDEDREFMAIQRIEADGSAREVIVERDWDIEAFSLDHENSRLAVVVNEDGYSRVEALRLDNEGRPGGSVEMASTPTGVIGAPVWTRSGDALLFSLMGARHPSHVWSAPIGEGAAGEEAHQLVASETGIVDPSLLAEPQLVRYPTFDGRQIPGYLFRPADSGPSVPCLVIVHGGPEAQSRPSLWAQSAAQLLMTEGVAVFVPNVRGSTGYGKEYEHADDREKRMDSVRDLVACTDWLVHSAGIDENRIGVVGQSYGGFMVLAAITEAPERWAMAVDLYGIANFETFMEFTGPWRRRHRAREYGDDPELLRSISPIHKADRITCPLLVIQGDRDVRVPQEESEQIVETVRGNGGLVEFVVYPDEGHGIQKLAHRLDMGERFVEFARRHLLGRS